MELVAGRRAGALLLAACGVAAVVGAGGARAAEPDLAPPVVTAVFERPPQFGGVYTAPVTVSWSVADPEPSSGVPTVPPPITVSEVGYRSIVSAPACDPAGNCATGSTWVNLQAEPGSVTLAFWDGPIVATRVVDFAFSLSNGASARDFYLSNDGAAVDGVLANATKVVNGSTWDIGPGPAGTRTVYGQARDGWDNWSPIVAVTLELVTDEPTLMTADDDHGGLGTGPGQWLAQTPNAGITAHASSGPSGYSVTFSTGTRPSRRADFADDEPLVVGRTYTVTGQPGASPAAWLSGSTLYWEGISCVTGGWFRIDALTLGTGGDVESAAIDYRLLCNAAVRSGVIRYNSSLPFGAVAQSDTWLQYQVVDVGDTAQRTVTVTNTGPATQSLGVATLTGEMAGDYRIVDDGCAGLRLATGDACAVTVEFVPTLRDRRTAYLELADATPRGSRSVLLMGYGREAVRATYEIQQVPEFGPGTAIATISTWPDSPAIQSGFRVDGVFPVGTATERSLQDPPGRSRTVTFTLGPGHHVIKPFVGVYWSDYVGDPPVLDPVEVDVGIATALTVRVPDGAAVVAGEMATIEAVLEATGPVGAGTLRLSDADSGEVLASGEVTWATGSVAVTRAYGLGERQYSATFTPASPTVQAATATARFAVVAGPRPDTILVPGRRAGGEYGYFEFRSPAPRVTFECRTSSSWMPCTSPWHGFMRNEEGSAPFAVRAKRADGLLDTTPAAAVWTVDFTGPLSTMHPAAFADGTTMDARRVIVRISWSARDDGSGVDRHQLERRVDGGSWIRVLETRATSSLQAVAFGHATEFRVLAVDRADVTGQPATTPALRPTLVSDRSLAYRGTWVERRSSYLLGGRLHATSVASRSASLTFTGRAVAVIVRTGRSNGGARMTVDDVGARTISTYRSTWVSRTVLGSRSWATAARHTLRVTNLATRGHPWLEIDGVVILR